MLRKHIYAQGARREMSEKNTEIHRERYRKSTQMNYQAKSEWNEIHFLPTWLLLGPMTLRFASNAASRTYASIHHPSIHQSSIHLPAIHQSTKNQKENNQIGTGNLTQIRAQTGLWKSPFGQKRRHHVTNQTSKLANTKMETWLARERDIHHHHPHRHKNEQA